MILEPNFFAKFYKSGKLINYYYYCTLIFIHLCTHAMFLLSIDVRLNITGNVHYSWLLIAKPYLIISYLISIVFFTEDHRRQTSHQMLQM